jgi:predicted amidophosphoribosyltransferase
VRVAEVAYSALALIAPPRCAICDRERVAAGLLCLCCDRLLTRTKPIVEPGPPGIEVAVAAGEFEGRLRELVLALKFGRRLALARRAAEAMLAACPDELLAGATIVPVPAAPLRHRWRGFDVAEELGLAVSELAGAPYRDCLRRDGGPRQVGRPRALRLAQPASVRAAGRAPPGVLLVDDVRTTGATLSASGAALRGAGARRITALTLARAR